jgi:hypothetical protein
MPNIKELPLFSLSGDPPGVLRISVIMATSTHIIGLLFTFQMIHQVLSPVIAFSIKHTSLSAAG